MEDQEGSRVPGCSLSETGGILKENKLKDKFSWEREVWQFGNVLPFPSNLQFLLPSDRKTGSSSWMTR
jgi:hypothetical protein